MKKVLCPKCRKSHMTMMLIEDNCDQEYEEYWCEICGWSFREPTDEWYDRFEPIEGDTLG